MKIAVLGWGSLIWDKRELSIADGQWHENGPLLPIEFARISNDGRLTLVIKPNWGEVKTLYAISSFDDISQAIENLRLREGTKAEKIGYYNFLTNEKQIRKANEIILPRLEEWKAQVAIDEVIWTDLPPNFQDRLKIPYTVENIGKYLNGLDIEAFDRAKQYVNRTPAQVETRFRKEIGQSLEHIYDSRLHTKSTDAEI
jgi:hypothetical protein